MKDSVEITFRPTPSLERLYLELTNRCNLSCEMCYRRTWREVEGDMSEELLEKISLDVQRFPELREVILGGIGEPTIAPAFRRAVELFAGRYEVTVTTNGTNLNSETVAFFGAHKISRIVFSVDSVDSATFAGIRHQNVHPVLESTHKLIASRVQPGDKPEIAWEFVAMKRTLPFLMETVRTAAQIGVDKIYISHLQPMAEDMLDEILYPVSAETERIFRQAFNYGLGKQLAVVLPQTGLKTERHCKFVESQSVVVRWDGEVAPCYRFLHAYPEYVLGRKKEIRAYSFGSLKDKRLDGIWMDPVFMEFRYKVRNGIYPSCPDCDFVNGCDIVTHADMDCMGNEPSCADCLWARGLPFCP
ncbi:tungsten cofactor oxidoreductase radical SAM maturase [Paradesulfitobacterium aromaticivorans]